MARAGAPAKRSACQLRCKEHGHEQHPKPDHVVAGHLHAAGEDLERARRLEDALGLAAVGAKPDGKFIYRCGGTELALFPRPDGTKAEQLC